MGNCNQQVSEAHILYKNTNWELISQNNYSVIMKNYRNPKLQLQKWFSQKIQKAIIYSWRTNNQKPGFGRIQHLGDQNNSSTQHSKKEKRRSYVITQILTPLSEIQTITTSECILLLKVILPALKLLCEKFGWFQIDSDMIFINSEGKPSVWIHPNLASNSPRFPLPSTARTQSSFIASVITVIRQKLQEYQKFNIEASNLNFRKMEILLQKQLNVKFPKLQKIFKTRAEFDLSEERRKYRQIATTLKRQSSVYQPISVTHMKSSSSHNRYKYTESTSRKQLATEQKTNSSNVKIKDSVFNKQVSSVKDPDEMLFELIRDYDLNK